MPAPSVAIPGVPYQDFHPSGSFLLLQLRVHIQPLRSTVVTRFFATMDSRKKNRGPPRFLDSSVLTRRLQPPRRVRWLLYPLLDHRYQASSATTDWPLPITLTRLNRVRLRCGSQVCLARLRVADCSKSTRLPGDVDEPVISTVNSFQFTR